MNWKFWKKEDKKEKTTKETISTDTETEVNAKK